MLSLLDLKLMLDLELVLIELELRIFLMHRCEFSQFRLLSSFILSDLNFQMRSEVLFHLLLHFILLSNQLIIHLLLLTLTPQQ